MRRKKKISFLEASDRLTLPRKLKERASAAMIVGRTYNISSRQLHSSRDKFAAIVPSSTFSKVTAVKDPWSCGRGAMASKALVDAMPVAVTSQASQRRHAGEIGSKKEWTKTEDAFMAANQRKENIQLQERHHVLVCATNSLLLLLP
mmetsp:Transcript_17875/g.58762  ORF Transcript_17875/g.58762 Transcript_17875/m.58762 type:complete len:147 (+) Transcript_17875:1560-2000(+)